MITQHYHDPDRPRSLVVGELEDIWLNCVGEA